MRTVILAGNNKPELLTADEMSTDESLFSACTVDGAINSGRWR